VAAALVATTLCACADMPWRADRTAPTSYAQIYRGESPDVTVPLPVFDSAHVYALVELIDLAQRNNPETRQAWQRARAEAARLGGAEAVYLPSLTLVATGGELSLPFPSPEGAFSVTGPTVEPQLELAWTLLDLTQFARVSEARARVTAANFAFSRKHQEVLFAVARAYYELDASTAQLEASRATLRSAVVDEEAAQARLQAGLATQPEFLLAREERTRAEFDVESAAGAVRDAEGALAESVGVAPDPPLRVAFGARVEPSRLATSIEAVMQATLAERPDLKAQRAEVLARKADERGARGRFAPRLSLDVAGGYQLWRYESSGATFTLSAPILDAHLSFAVGLFQGFADVEAVHEAESERAASEAALAAGSLRALRQTWTAYFDVKTAERKVEFADALLAASDEAYASSLETYRHGLGSLLDLLTAERDLAAARGIAIASHAELLTSAAALTLAIGAIPPGAH
jgi:outer membrane protein